MYLYCSGVDDVVVLFRFGRCICVVQMWTMYLCCSGVDDVFVLLRCGR